MGFLAKRKDSPLFIKDLGAGEAIVVSTSAVIESLGEARETVPSSFIRAVGATMPVADKVVGSLSGRIVKLSEESIRLLRANDIVPKNGLVTGVVRNPKTGEFAGLLSFQRIDLATSVASSLPAIAAGMALQIQLARIEKQLGAIDAKLDYVIKQGHLQLEARLLAAVHILNDVASDCLPQGFVDDDSWDRIGEVEDDIRELVGWAASNLEPTRRALSDPSLNLGGKVRVLKEVLERDRAEWWLKARVAAEIALLKWEQLFLLRRAMTTPDEMDKVISRVETAIEVRHYELVELRDALEAWSQSSHESDRILDRLRLLKRKRLGKLVAQLPPMVEAYDEVARILPATRTLPLPNTKSGSKTLNAPQ
jgi:hypothetical protein